MKAKIILVKNHDEIMKAEAYQDKVGFGDIPEKEQTANAILFNIEDVKIAFVQEKGLIRVLMHDEYFDFGFCEQLWAVLSERFK